MGRPHPSLVELAAGRPLPRVDDGHELVRSAAEHRMDGLLWSVLRDRPDAIDAASASELGQRSLMARAHHRALWNTLARATTDLRHIGIEVATFKGVTAEARWYDAPGERPCADLDLLVAPHDHHRIGELVALLQPSHPLAPDVASLVAGGALQSIELIVDGISIDVHLDLFKLGIPSLQREAIWARTRPLSTPFGDARVLDPETALVHLLLHLNKDRFRRLLGYVDITRVVERESIDWDAVAGIAGADGLLDVVALSLDCVNETLGLPAARLPRPTGWQVRAWKRLWPESVRLQGDIGVVGFHLRQALLPALARGRGREAVRASTRRLVPPAALVRYRNPGASGGYVRQLTTGRVERTLARRRALRRLRRDGGRAHERGATATQASG